MEITSEMVKHLRQITGAGMMDCKRVLHNCDGNEELAKEWLKYSGRRMSTIGKVSCSRAFMCEFCQKEVCENTYDDDSETCRKCLVRKCEKK